ncbi:MAG: pyruvate carboxylase [Helicobacteraceae bacterium]|nr:pyruvate carboxylase [Helicobacteraceae bacterium]
MTENLVAESLKFMVLGMGTVFMFLIIMIIVMNLQAKIVHRFFPEPEPVEPTPTLDTSAQAKKVAAATAAIMHHRNS